MVCLTVFEVCDWSFLATVLVPALAVYLCCDFASFLGYNFGFLSILIDLDFYYCNAYEDNVHGFVNRIFPGTDPGPGF